jgi:hypothetical protein
MYKIAIDVIIDTTEEGQCETAARHLFNACKARLQKGPCATKITMQTFRFQPNSPIIRPEQIQIVKELTPSLTGAKVQTTR